MAYGSQLVRPSPPPIALAATTPDAIHAQPPPLPGCASTSFDKVALGDACKQMADALAERVGVAAGQAPAGAASPDALAAEEEALAAEEVAGARRERSGDVDATRR